MFGDLKALQLHGCELLAQLAAALPGSVAGPGDEHDHSSHGQNESDQPVFHAAAHCVTTKHLMIGASRREAKPPFVKRVISRLSELVSKLSCGADCSGRESGKAAANRPSVCWCRVGTRLAQRKLLRGTRWERPREACSRNREQEFGLHECRAGLQWKRI